MQEYYFLFGLAFVWIAFAVVQDLRTREISNWLNFSLLGVGMLYRAGYALSSGNDNFFWFGLFGVVFFTAIAYLCYYSRVFAGGDAKLLIGLGAVLPFSSFESYLFLGIGFVVLLFVSGSIWGMAWTFVEAYRQKKNFIKVFRNKTLDNRKILMASACLGILGFVAMIFYNLLFALLFLLVFVLAPLLIIYIRAVESACFVQLISPGALMEGDWLLRDVVLRGKVIKKSVHGLSQKEIAILRRAGKKVWVKSGIPFAPAFLIAFAIMVFAFSRSGGLLELLRAFLL